MPDTELSYTKNFTRKEFACKCGCGDDEMDLEFINRLQSLRELCGFPIIISSGKRCPEHNAKVSSTGKTGPHTTGKAVDISVDRTKAHKVLKMALRLGFTGIGVQQKGKSRFIHIDSLEEGPDCPRPTVWSY